MNSRELEANLPSRIAARRRALLDRVMPGLELAGSHGDCFANYRLLRVLGEGASGVVWEAIEKQTGQVVAIKAFKVFGVEPDTARVSRELALASRVEHPNVVRILDSGQRAMVPFAVMELLCGRTLKDALTEGSLPWPDAKRILIKLCDGLKATHAAGVVHRDIKPSNIVLVEEDQRGAVLVDFGVAKDLWALEATVGMTSNAVVGTPHYMSPEQLRGTRVDARSDIYSLGIVAYEMCVGRPPFGSSSFAELVVEHLTVAIEGELAVPLEGRAKKQLTAVLQKSLRKDPDNRFGSAEELREALLSVGTKARAVRVPPEPNRRNVSKAWRFVPLALAAAATAAIAMALVSDCRPSAAFSPQPSNIAPVMDIALGLDFTCAVGFGGDATCWGADNYGSLGRGGHGLDIGDNEEPLAVESLALGSFAPLRAIFAGSSSRAVCAASTSNELICWGSNRFGQLGLGNRDHYGDESNELLTRLTPLPLPNVEAISIGSFHICGTFQGRTDRQVYCWGRNNSGQLGAGHRESIGDDESLDGLEPVDFGGALPIQVSAGSTHSCALLSDARVACWGSNTFGELGLGESTGALLTPAPQTHFVRGLETIEVVKIVSSNHRTCAQGAAGELRCWGSNKSGALGYAHARMSECRGTTCFLRAPTIGNVELGSDQPRVVDISLGYLHGCALDELGQIRCFGSGLYGRLGYGSTKSVGGENEPSDDYSRLPRQGVVDVGDLDRDGQPDRTKKVVAGARHTCALTTEGAVRCWGSGSGGRLGYQTTSGIGDRETPGETYRRTQRFQVAAFPAAGTD